MDIIVPLCGNAMIIIDQPVIILISTDNDCTIILLVWTRIDCECHCVVV